MSQQSNTKDIGSYFHHWQTPQFYRSYYRRFVYFAILLTLLAIMSVGAAAYKFYTQYLQEGRQYYVSTSAGELVLLDPQFTNKPLQKNTGDQ